MPNNDFVAQFEQLAGRFDSITPDKFSRPELLAELRKETDQRVLANRLRMNLDRSGKR